MEDPETTKGSAIKARKGTIINKAMINILNKSHTKAPTLCFGLGS
jgi:hypothetical protein